MMRIRMDELLHSISTGLDYVEKEMLGASSHHGKRVACLCAAAGRYMGMGEKRLEATVGSALLHDSALTEYVPLMKKGGGKQKPSVRLHCEKGQQNVFMLPFSGDAKDLVLYHHERADGKGPYGKREGETPPGAQLIAAADMLDVSLHLQSVLPQKLPVVHHIVMKNTGKQFTRAAARAIVAVLDEDMLASLCDARVDDTMKRYLPAWTVDLQKEQVLRLADMSARIIDYKSAFTKKHSTQIADRAWTMGRYYGFDDEKCHKLYLAAALHDVGKLSVPTNVLEKPGVLTPNEFGIIKDHVLQTHNLLSEVGGFEEITPWAAGHHEKLDGSGYPFGLDGSRMDFASRLMACIDIYQAVIEERPYHPARTHKETMAIVYPMAHKGGIDLGIAKDIDRVMAAFPACECPGPPRAEENGGLAM